MHGFIIVLLTEEEAQQDKANLLRHIENLVYPYKYVYYQGKFGLRQTTVGSRIFSTSPMTRG